LTEAKEEYTSVDQRCSGNFIGAWALLGMFAYICRQRPIIHCIHEWKWRSPGTLTPLVRTQPKLYLN